MVNRVQFQKGQQRKFLQKVLEKINCPSLRELINWGFDVPYSTLKNYYSEARLLPEDLFKNLCYVAEINSDSLKFIYLSAYWGQKKGGLTK